MERNNRNKRKDHKKNNKNIKLIIHKIQECIGNKKEINNLSKVKIKLHYNIIIKLYN
jgi:hypothetical protein